MNNIYNRRFTAKTDRPFVVDFLIGMRINKWWRFDKWLPVARSMGPMLQSLFTHPEKGFLHAEFFWNFNGPAKALEEFGLPYVVIERDPDIIRRLQIRGTPCLYGDASHYELLAQARAADASLIIVALPEIEPAALAVRRIRTLNPHVHILARAHGQMDAEKLATVGASDILQPEVEASVTLIRHALDWSAVPKDRIREYAERYRNSVDPKRPSGEAAEPSANRKDDIGAVTN